MRYISAAIAGSVAVFYLVYFFIVNASVPPGENAPVYLIGAILFLLGAVLLVLTDRRSLWMVGAVVPTLAVCVYLWNGVHGEWEDPAAGILISVAEVALLALLVILAMGRPARSDQPVT